MFLPPSLFENTSRLFLLTGITFSIILIIILLSIYLCIHQRRSKTAKNLALAKKRLIYSSPASLSPQIPTRTTDRFVFPLLKLSNTETYVQPSVNEIASNYKTFDLSTQRSRYLSSDSSYTPTNTKPRRSNRLSTLTLENVKTKLQHMHRRASPSPISRHQLQIINSEQISSKNFSDSDKDENEVNNDNNDNQSSTNLRTPSCEYTLTDLFRIDLIYKLYYSTDNNQLLFELVRLISSQTLIEHCFPILICKIRLYTATTTATNDKSKRKKYFSKKNPQNEIFKFDVDQYVLEQSYLNIHVFGQHKHDKRLDLGHIAIVLNQYENLIIRVGQQHDGGLEASPQHIKSIPLYEDRIDMITQQQLTTENEARALVCLVYENDRCLLQVGVIKILDIKSLLKPTAGHLHNRDLIQIKICKIVDGKILEKSKSKPIPIEKDLFTYSAPFHFDYISLHKTLIRIIIYYKKNVITSQNKILSIMEFGSTHLKNQQTFQHWTDTIAAPNRPHIQWHILQPI